MGVLGASAARYVVLPKAWCDGTGIVNGSTVEVLFDGVLVVVPPGMDRAASRVLAALQEGGHDLEIL